MALRLKKSIKTKVCAEPRINNANNRVSSTTVLQELEGRASSEESLAVDIGILLAGLLIHCRDNLSPEAIKNICDNACYIKATHIEHGAAASDPEFYRAKLSCAVTLFRQKNIDNAYQDYVRNHMATFSKEERQKGGKVYTPQENITWIHDKLEEQSPLSLHKTYWDPACGTGHFLLDWYDRLKKHWENSRDQYSEIKNEREAHKWIIEKCIYFSDIDPFAIRLCKLGLFLKDPNTQAQFNSYLGDSLLDQPFGDRKFDYVAGNPPYIGMQRRGDLTEEYKQQLQSCYTTFNRKGDIYYLFIEAGINRLTARGVLGFVTQDTFINARAAESLRSLIKDKGAITASCAAKFKGAQVHVRSFVFEYGSQKEVLLVECPIISKLRLQKRKLADITSIRNGLLTGADKIFIVSSATMSSESLEVQACQPIIRGEHARSYSVIVDNMLDEFVIKTNGMPEDKIVNILKRVQPHKENLCKRHIARTGTIKRYFDVAQTSSWPQQDELIVAALYTETGKDFALCRASRATGLNASIYALSDLSRVWLGLLNSNVSAYYFQQTSQKRTDALLQRTSTYIKALPVPDNFEQAIPVLSPAVDKMLQNPDDTEAQSKINNIVYRLYGLTEKEIATIESML